ncbi:MAG: DUF5719 family protein, partial [Propionibacteriaceae bacterium]|nr:DUF5719 family protein [Propionibacteriaceae bacterium]
MSHDDWPTGRQARVSEEIDDAPVEEKQRARRGSVAEDDVDETPVAETKASRRAEPKPDKSRKSRGRVFVWLRRFGEAALALAILSGVVFLAGLGSGVTPAPPPRLNVTSNLFCQNIAGLGGSITGAADSDLKWQPDGEAAVPGSNFFQHTVSTESTLQGTGSVAGVVQFGSGAQVAAASCAAPAASGYLQTGAANPTLMMQNIDDQAAILNIAILGANGEIDPKDLIDLTIPPGTVKQINIADYAPGVSPVAVRWQSTVGRVLAWLVDSGSSGVDIVAPTSAGTQIVVPGVPGGATVQVLITNPATVRIKAQVEALTAQGRVGVSGAEKLTIEAGSTAAVDITSALSTDPTALVVTAEQPVAASAWLTHASDRASSPGLLLNVSSGVDGFGVTPGHSQLVISNVDQTDTTVMVTLGSAPLQTLQIAAGVTTAIDAPQAGTVRVSGVGVVSALVIRGGTDDASGMSVVA